MREGDISFTYMVECSDGTLYTGWTKELENRMLCHNRGKGAKYTKVRLPVRLVHYEKYANRQEAMKREYAIKQLSRKDKLSLVENQSAEVKLECQRIWDKCQRIFSDAKEMKKTNEAGI